MKNQTTTPEKGTDKRPWILAALMCTIMLAALDATIVSTAIPQIVGDLGGFSLFGWVFSIYLLAQTVTVPLYGKLTDLYGRKPILIFGMTVFLIGSSFCGLAWNMTSLIFFRGMQGIGAGAIMATVNTIAGDIYTVEERARVQGWLSSVWGMAAIAGPSIGGFFAEYSSWRGIFFINIPVGIIAMSLLIIYLKEHVERRRHYIDLPGAVLMLLTGTVLLYTLMEAGNKWEWLSPVGIVWIALSVFLAGVTVYVERRSKEPIMPVWVWSNRTILGANLAMMGMGAIMLGPSMYLPAFSQSVKGLGAVAAGFILTSSSLGWPLASSQSGRLYMKIGFRNTALIGAGTLIVLSFLFTLLSYESSPWLLVINQCLLGAGFGLLSTPSLVGIQSIVPWEKRGVVTSSNMFSRYLGQSIGAAVFGGVFNRKMGNILSQAPENLKDKVPNVNDVIDVMQSHNVSDAVDYYLRVAFYEATQHVYLIMMLIAVITFLVLFLQPSKLNILQDEKSKTI